MTCEQWAAGQDDLDRKARLIELVAYLQRTEGGMSPDEARRAARRWWREEASKIQK
jgi:hypothetical protein